MTLDEELRVFDIYNQRVHHHQSVEGKHALKMMRDDIVGRYFKGTNEPLKEFKLAYMNYQLEQAKGGSYTQ